MWCSWCQKNAEQRLARMQQVVDRQETVPPEENVDIQKTEKIVIQTNEWKKLYE